MKHMSSVTTFSSSLTDKRCRSHIDKVCKFCADRGWRVKLGKNLSTGCVLASKTITLRQGGSVRNQLYALLHELGHMLIFSDSKQYFIVLLAQSMPENTKAHRTSVIFEEALAWKAGWEFGAKRGFDIDPEEYIVYAAKNFMTYVKWAVEP